MSDHVMSYRQLGNCGLKVSAIGLGSWMTYGEKMHETGLIHRIYKKAYDAGVRYYDTSSNYAGGHAESLMGQALKDFPRHTLALSSKAYFPISEDPNDRGLSRKHIVESVERSLRHLNTDYLDIFFCHRFDEETPLEETLHALDDLVHQGKILYWGTSQWRSDQIDRMASMSRKTGSRLQAEQVELNLFNRRQFECNTQPIAKRHGLGLVTFSPLASGMLSGKYDEGIPAGSRLDSFSGFFGEFSEMHRMKSLELKALAHETGCTRAQLAIAWCLAKPGVSSVLTGASGEEQLEENLGALNVRLTNTVIRRLNRVFAPGFKSIARFHARQIYCRLRDALR